jgi:aldehyde dehydrogenase
MAYHIHEPLGVVGQIIPWNFPILMAAWKLAPAIGAGNCVVLKPAESTPISILILAELIADLLPPGVLNIVNGYGREAGMPLATSKRIAKIAFTGSTATGRVIAQAAANNLIPATLELGGKSPNIFFADVMDKDDAFLDKAIEGMVLFAFNQGEVCTCPSRALIQESIYDKFMERVLKRVAAIKQGSPLDTDTMMGAQAPDVQMEQDQSYLKLGKQEGAECLIGGERAHLGGDLEGGYYIQPTLFKGHNKMRIFQEEIFGPVLAVTTFKDEAEALAIANDTPTASAPACGAVTATSPTAWAAPSRPAACGPTATTPTRRTQPSAATRNPASAAKPTRSCSTTTSRPRTCWSATASRSWASSKSLCIGKSGR